MGGVKHVTSDSEFDSLLSSAGQKLVVVDFFATWCAPCRMLAPVFESLSERYPGAVFLKVDVDQCGATAAALSVRAMPTVLLFKGGSKIGEVVGADPAAIQRLIDQHYDAFASFSGTARKLTDSAPSAPATATGAAEPAAEASGGLGQTGDCEVQVRLPTGEMLRGRFDKAATLAQVRQFVSTSAAGLGAGFKLMLPGFPKKVYEEADMGHSLEEEQLTPRAQLIVCK